MSIQILDQVSKVKGLEGNKYILLQHANAFVFNTIQIPLQGFLVEPGCWVLRCHIFVLQMDILKFFMVVVVVLVQ